MLNRFFLFPLAITMPLLFFTKTDCNTTAVQLAQIPITGGSINAPGTYYVGYDITGGITIAADSISLNLNGHTVRNIIMENRDNVSITNGVVNSSTALAPTVSAGISISGSTNIHLSNLKVLYAGSTANLIRGIHTKEGNNLFLSNILVEGFSSTGCKVEGIPQLLRISDCTFNKNGSTTNSNSDDDRTGLFIDHNNPTNSSLVNIIVERCLATGNRTDGFRVSGRSLKTTVWFFDCTASNNGVEPGLVNSQSNGFHGKQITSPGNGNFAAIRCIAENNANHGFWTESNTLFYFERCIACNNTNDGFRARGDSIGQVKECTALGNGECGFNNDGPGDNDQPVAYVANFANTNQNHNYCLNGDNRRRQFPYCVRSIDDDEALFWRNTDA